MLRRDIYDDTPHYFVDSGRAVGVDFIKIFKIKRTVSNQSKKRVGKAYFLIV